MTNKEIIDGLNLLENNLTEFDELTENGTDYIDVHEVIFEAIEALDKCDKIEKIIDSYDADFIANYVRGLFAE